MAAGKWIAELTPESSYLDAARHVLAIRLEMVRHCLESIQAQVDQDPEYVHQLRVSTRRAKAALDVFKACVPKKAGRKVRKALRQFRSAAGAVRDWDVFLHGLNSHKESKQRRLRPTLDLVSGLALSRRDAARTALLESSSDQPFAFERLLTKTLGSLKRPRNGADVRLGDLAIRFMSKQFEALSKAAEAAVDDHAKLHLVRISGKRLRYAMEIFGDCFAADFKEKLYAHVEQLQDLLGVLHDSDVAIQHLQAWRERTAAVFPDETSRYRPGFDALIQSHETIVSEKRASFTKKWREWREATGAGGLDSLHLKTQRGELVSIAGKDNMAPAGRAEPSLVEDVGLTGAPPGGSP